MWSRKIGVESGARNRIEIIFSFFQIFGQKNDPILHKEMKLASATGQVE
jgi:hypothetical protein